MVCAFRFASQRCCRDEVISGWSFCRRRVARVPLRSGSFIFAGGCRLRWPRYARVAQEPSRYVNDLVSGFEVIAEVFGFPRTAQRFFREVVLQTAGQDQRVLLRATAQYARLLRESFDARNMISAGDRWRH